MSPPRRPLHWAWLGRRPYVPVWHQQRAIREALLRGEGTETLLLVEHEPVITLGRRAAPATALRVPEPTLAGAGVEVHQVERGGEATWHGPGQLTGYPLVRLATLAMDVPTFVAALEQAMIDFVSCRGVACHRVPGRHGV